MKITRGVGVATYERAAKLPTVLDAIRKTVPEGTRLVVADDGSEDETFKIVKEFPEFVYIRGPNKGVGYNKNRALVALQDCDFIAILEDDLYPIRPNWFEAYEQAVKFSGIHHFCRVQDNIEAEVVPEFFSAMQQQGLQPIYGPSPRGDFTFITKKVVRVIGGFNKDFKGAGFAHGEWSNRCFDAGLIGHPRKWVDIRGSNGEDYFKQVGDTEGGRWTKPKEEIQNQIRKNRMIKKKLRDQKDQMQFQPLILQ